MDQLLSEESENALVRFFNTCGPFIRELHYYGHEYQAPHIPSEALLDAVKSLTFESLHCGVYNSEDVGVLSTLFSNATCVTEVKLHGECSVVKFFSLLALLPHKHKLKVLDVWSICE